jgi:uncharacterized protein (DUF3820 family)
MKTNRDGLIVIPFGKYKDTPLKYLKTKYMDWLLAQDWFCEKFADLKEEVIKELKTRSDWNNMEDEEYEN